MKSKKYSFYKIPVLLQKALIIFMLLLGLMVGFCADAAPISGFAGDVSVSSNPEPILTLVTPEGKVRLTLAQVEARPMVETTLAMRGFDVGSYQGVRLTDLLAAYHLADSARLRLVALDGYVISLTLEDLKVYPSVLATRFEGLPIDIAHKGPLMLLWPSLDNDKAAEWRWIWNLVEIGPKK